MTGVMGEILEHYGQTVTLRSRDGEKSVRAFIQPAAARDETVPGEQTPIGWIDERPSTANGILDRMEEKGLIRRTADENDQRQKQVTATEKGRELNSLVQAAFQEAEAVMVKGLRLEETEALRLLLYRVIENLEEDRTTC